MQLVDNELLLIQLQTSKNPQSVLAASLCFPLTWVKKIYNNCVCTTKQHKRVCVDKNLQEHTANPPEPVKCQLFDSPAIFYQISNSWTRPKAVST